MGLNVALFMPLGAALAHARAREATGAALVSLAAELLQLNAIAGRYGEFQGIIANGAGGVIGWRAVRLVGATTGRAT